jgi:hypothetical protein
MDIGIEIHVSAADLAALEVEIDSVQDNKPIKDKTDSVHADMPLVVGPTNDVRIVECNNNEVTNQPSQANKPAQTMGNMKKKRRGQFCEVCQNFTHLRTHVLNIALLHSLRILIAFRAHSKVALTRPKRNSMEGVLFHTRADRNCKFENK